MIIADSYKFEKYQRILDTYRLFHIAECILQILLNRINRCAIVAGKDNQNQQTGNQYAKLETNAANIGKNFISISNHKGVYQQQSHDKSGGAGQEKVHGALSAYHLYDILPIRPDLE